MAQNKGGRNNHRYIAQKRNDKRRKSVTETADTIKPRQIMCRARVPSAIVSGFAVKSAISGFAANRQPKVPASIMAAVMASVVS